MYKVRSSTTHLSGSADIIMDPHQNCQVSQTEIDSELSSAKDCENNDDSGHFPKEYIKPQPLSGPINYSRKLELEEDEYVTVKAKAPLGKFGGKKVEKIPKHEAICKFCFDAFQPDMLKTNCKCKFALAHESCATEWSQKKGNNKCDDCEQDIQNIPVTVSRNQFSSPQRTNNSTHNRFFGYLCCLSSQAHE